MIASTGAISTIGGGVIRTSTVSESDGHVFPESASRVKVIGPT